ncbi:hypothetical protein F4604DRAFT_1684122 [Suillus subluteus]|nr:hypothetical protein F4604DRAFT_1684122 [Suillus subluteus]
MKKKDRQGRLQELADDHIKPLVDLFATDEGKCQVLWIWMMYGVNCSDEGDDNGVRIEWCKSHVRALRWLEEVELLMEEMHRVLQFFAWLESMAPFPSPEGPGGFVINDSPPKDSLPDHMIPDILVSDHCS